MSEYVSPERYEEIIRIREDKIQQLERELKEAKAKLTANRFIFRTKVRNEYLDKIEDLELQRDGQSITIKGQRKDNAELNNANTRLRESNFYLQKEIDTLKSQLSNIKTLDRRNIWELIDEYKIRIVDDKGFVTAICSLALPEVEEEVDLSESFYNPGGD